MATIWSIDILRIGIEIDSDQCRYRTAQEMILKDGSHEAASLGSFGVASVSTSVSISIVDMDETSRLTFTKANKLGPPQAPWRPSKAPNQKSARW